MRESGKVPVRRFAGSPVRRFADDPAVQDCVASPVQLVGTPHVVGFLGFRVAKTRAHSDELTIHILGWITTWFVVLNLCAGLLACCWLLCIVLGRTVVHRPLGSYSRHSLAVVSWSRLVLLGTWRWFIDRLTVAVADCRGCFVLLLFYLVWLLLDLYFCCGTSQE